MHEGTAGWVILAILLLAVIASTALWIGWKDSQEIRLGVNASSSSQMLHTGGQPIKQDYGKQVDALQQRVAQAEKAASDMQDQFNRVSQQFQATQDELKKSREELHRAVENETRQIVALDN